MILNGNLKAVSPTWERHPRPRLTGRNSCSINFNTCRYIYLLLNGVKECEVFNILHCTAGNGFQFKLGILTEFHQFICSLLG